MVMAKTKFPKNSYVSTKRPGPGFAPLAQVVGFDPGQDLPAGAVSVITYYPNRAPSHSYRFLNELNGEARGLARALLEEEEE